MESNKIPAAQISVLVIKKAIKAFEWMVRLENQWEDKVAKHEDASVIREEQEILLDIFCVYIGSLVDKTKGTHSLVRSYEDNVFINLFCNHPIVKDCVVHRHNRAGHQSTKYGSVVSLNLVLSSDLLLILKSMHFVVCRFGTK